MAMRNASPVYVRGLSRALSNAMVWATIFAAGSIVGFVVAVAATLVLQIDLMGIFATGYKYFSMWLGGKHLIGAENVGVAILLGHVVPWLIAGACLGFAGKLLRPEGKSFAKGIVAVSTVVVLIVTVSALLILWW